MSEKQNNTVEVGSAANSDIVSSVVDETLSWTPDEEKKLRRRVDFIVMPLLIAGFFVMQLDRGNIGNAFTDNFLEDVGITQFQYNVGNQLMYLGIVLFEIPSNLVLYRLGPAVWIGAQMSAWGLVATLQAFIKGKGLGPWLATRFILGTCECGYIPASLFTITRFYKKEETSKRFALFFFGNMAAAGSSGLLAFAILRMRDVSGLSGWQWLFIIEGVITLGIAVIFVLFFPRSTSRPVSLVGLRYFNERDAAILTARVIKDEPSKLQSKTHVSRSELKTVFTNWRLIGHVITTIAMLSATTSLSAFAPSIIASYGYSKLRANAMSSIGQWILLLTTITWGWTADKWGRRGPMVLLGVTISWILVVANRSIATSDNLTGKFVVIVLIAAFSFNWHPVHGSWMALNAKTDGERSITMAIFIMAANVSGIAGGQIFQANDAPKYVRAWSVTMALACVGVVSCALTNLQYWWLNRRNAKRGDQTFVYAT